VTLVPARRPAPICLAVCLGLVLVACGDGVNEGVNEGRGARGTIDGVVLHAPESVDVTSPPTAPENAPANTDGASPTDDAFGWTTLSKGVEEGHLDVPLDYADPSAGTITLYLERHLAEQPSKRIGTLLVNPGGPGYGGSSLADDAANEYGQALLDRFDIVGWDPRGTGSSEPAIDCVSDLDHYFAVDSSPDTEAGRQLLIDRGKDHGAACEHSNGSLLAHVGTADSARDMDSIRQALGEEKISYFGFSYGSELGATWATMFPHTVRAVVLDGSVDPTLGAMARDLQQARGFEDLFDRFLAECSATASCAFHNGGDAAGAFDRLHEQVDRTPVKVTPKGRPAVNQAILDVAVVSSLYDHSGWGPLETALADLQAGDGTGILGLYDDYNGYDRGSWDNGQEAYFAIDCLDDRGRTSPANVFAHEADFAAAAPRLGRSWIEELVYCSEWPAHTFDHVAITGVGAGPILVVATTGDPATPFTGTEAMATTLEDGHLVIVHADQHTGYGVNDCVDHAVEDYLVRPTAPLAATTDCP
jgi:pimeloyl-ACP methyl ester carboxylesterase